MYLISTTLIEVQLNKHVRILYSTSTEFPHGHLGDSWTPGCLQNAIKSIGGYTQNRGERENKQQINEFNLLEDKDKL